MCPFRYKITLDSSLESPGKYFLFIPCDGQKCTSSDDFLSSVSNSLIWMIYHDC